MAFVRRNAAFASFLVLCCATANAAVVLTPVATGLAQPLYVTHAGDGRIFIVEKAGTIRILTGGIVLPTPFADLSSIVGSSGSEQGLLGLAFHPAHTSNRQLFVNYTDDQGDSVVARYRTVPGDPNRLDPGSAEVLLAIDQPFANHNGGHLAFGPDGYLYLGFGDGGAAGDPMLNGQNPLTLLGKILRIDVNVASGYAIPPDNPRAGLPLMRGEVWAQGLRNPWRFSFDRATGDLFIGDVGQFAWEEIDFQPAASAGGENYGWNLFEGNHQFPTGIAMPFGPPPFAFPIAEYGHGEGCSVTGGYVYRGPSAPSLAGRYVFGDFCSGTVWTLTGTGGAWTRATLLSTSLGISSFGEDQAGELYVTDFFDGAVYRFDEN